MSLSCNTANYLLKTNENMDGRKFDKNVFNFKKYKILELQERVMSKSPGIK